MYVPPPVGYTIIEDSNSGTKCSLPENRQYWLGNIPNVWGFSNCINELTFPVETKFTEINWTYSMWDDVVNDYTIQYDFKHRPLVIKILVVAHIIFDIGGYIPGVSTITGIARIAIACSVKFILPRVAGFRERSAYRTEFYWTVRGHMIRGAIEIIPGIGQIVNFCLDLSYYKWRKVTLPLQSDFTLDPQIKEEAGRQKLYYPGKQDAPSTSGDDEGL